MTDSQEKRVKTERRHCWTNIFIAILCIYASLTPLRADVLMSGDLRLEFFWTQMHKLTGGISVQNAEILFPIGSFVLFFVAVCSIAQLAAKNSKHFVLILMLCLTTHVLLRGPVDFYLISTYWPFTQSEFYWNHVGVGWWFLAFTGGIASVVAIGLRFFVLIANKCGTSIEKEAP